MTSLCLNMIVRNESARIIRALQSVAPHISSYVIMDTGSTDDTVAKITKFFDERKIVGVIGKCEFEDFSQARNIALTAARHAPFEFDYVLLMDADMELRATPGWADDLDGIAYDIQQQSGYVSYPNRRLIRKNSMQTYTGATHEFLDVESAGCVDPHLANFMDHADGSNRVKKYKRDIALLKGSLAKYPNDERAMYYLAQSYRDAGKFDKAAKWYQKRVTAGGWDEEVWSAQYSYAHCLNAMGDEAGFIRNLLTAYNMRPVRAEPLYDLAKHYREKGDNPAGALFAEAGMAVPRPKDALFVNDYIYDVGCREEFAITAFYVPRRKAAGFKVNNELSLMRGPYPGVRELARNNMFYYYPLLKEFCPSFQWRPIEFTAPEGYTAMNPSICADVDGHMHGIIRTVNYKIDEWGRYLIKATDGTANATNPINTRNFFVDFDMNFKITNSKELVIPRLGHTSPFANKGDPWPEPKFPLVTGMEDMRLYSYKGALWANCCVREFTDTGWCEQVRVCLDDLIPTRMIDRDRDHEKNWMPILDGSARFMYRCDEIVDDTGKTIQKYDLTIDVGTLAGGSQVVPFSGGYLAAVHEARNIPGQQTRYYAHRWVWFDKDLKLELVSPPFGLNEKGIEYIIGLHVEPVLEHVYISYGFKDREPRLGIVSIPDVERMLSMKASDAKD